MSTQDYNDGRLLPSFPLIGGCLSIALATSIGTVHAEPLGAGGPLTTLVIPSPRVTMMSVGDGTTCAAFDDGRAKCWGHNDRGQLGRGDDTWIGDEQVPGDAEPIEVGGFVEEIRSNGRQTYVRLDTGVVRAWGIGDAHALGLQHTETIGDDETPAQASVAVDLELGGPAVSLALGDDFACALLVTGAVQCWGSNDVGQLGLGHTQRIGDDESPANAGSVGLGAPAVSLVAGAHHACAVLEGGTVRCWGLNDSGQLGYGHTQDIGDDEQPWSQAPVDVGGAVVELAAGERHTCARLDTGGVRCWGSNHDGQLGRGTPETVGDDEVPASRLELTIGGAVASLAAGARHTCAVMQGGGLRCWGEGLEGQLGYGNSDCIGDDETPLLAGEVDVGDLGVAQLFIGPTASSTCVQRDDGAVRCWGLNDVGQLGYGDTASRGDSPATTPGRISDVVVVRSGDD